MTIFARTISPSWDDIQAQNLKSTAQVTAAYGGVEVRWFVSSDDQDLTPEEATAFIRKKYCGNWKISHVATLIYRSF
jgi:hypothetical protein